jgi:hypothetical protein
MTDSNQSFQTSALKPDADYPAPDGSEIRLLPAMKGGWPLPLHPAGRQDLLARGTPACRGDLVRPGGAGRSPAEGRQGRGDRSRERRDEPDDSAAHGVPVP